MSDIFLDQLASILLEQAKMLFEEKQEKKIRKFLYICPEMSNHYYEIDIEML